MNAIVNLIVPLLSGALAAIVTVKLFQKSEKRTSTYECDRLFMEIEKTLLAEPRLWEFYNVGTQEQKKQWQGFTDDEKRMFIFCEMNYFHFAFVYREFKRGVIRKDYWNVYEAWLKKLIRYSPIFRHVHLISRPYFEPEFTKLVDELQKDV